MSEIIWQPSSLVPYNYIYGFQIDLDWDFAHKMFSSKGIEKGKKVLNDKACEYFNIFSSEPFNFYQDSGFVKTIDLGSGGRLLNVDSNELKCLRAEHVKRNIEYHTHNIDNVTDAHTLLALFDLWIKYADALIEE